MATFDKTKPYGEVHGASDGTRYVQGDKSFDCNGDEIGATPPVTKGKAAKAPKASADAALDGVNQLNAQLADLA